MKFLENFDTFEPKTIDELLEKLSIVEESILDSIDAELVNIESFLTEDIYIGDIEDLNKNHMLDSILRSKGLKKNKVEYTDDYETFLVSPFKFFLAQDKRKNSLQNPDYIFIQTYNQTKNEWNNVRLYKINGDFNNFYDKLSNRTIEIEHGDSTYLYQTSNKNQWDLVNREPSEDFPKNVRKEDLIDILNRVRNSIS